MESKEAVQDPTDIATLMAMGPMAPIENTHPIYAALRKDQPVFDATNTQEEGVKDFIITRYEDVKYVLKNDKLFSNAINQQTMGLVMGPTVIGMDGHEHLKHRTLVTPSVTPKALKGDNFEAVVKKTANDTID